MSDIKKTADSFTEPQSNQEIHAPLDSVLIGGTMRMCDLVLKYLDVIRDTPEYVQLMDHLPSVVTDPSATEQDARWDSEEVLNLYQELCDVLYQYRPEGYTFGKLPGSGTDFGYWKQATFDIAAIESSLPHIYEQHILPKAMTLEYHVNCAASDQQIDTDRVMRVVRDETGCVMVGNKQHMVNLDALTDESLSRLRTAVAQVMIQKDIDENDALSVIVERAKSDRDTFTDEEVAALEKHFDNCRLSTYGVNGATSIQQEHRRKVFIKLFDGLQDIMAFHKVPDSLRDAVRKELENLAGMTFAKRLTDAKATFPYNDICKEFAKIDDNTKKIALSFMNDDSDFARDQLFGRIVSGPDNGKFWAHSCHEDAAVMRLIAYSFAESYPLRRENIRSELLVKADSFELSMSDKYEYKPAIQAVIERADSTAKTFTDKQITAIEAYFDGNRLPEAMTKGDEIHHRHHLADKLWEAAQPEMDKQRIYPEWRQEAKADLDILADGRERYAAKAAQIMEEGQGGPAR